MIRFNETEIRNSAKEILESLEHWSRRIINDKFTEKYGRDYFELTIISKFLLDKLSVLSMKI